MNRLKASENKEKYYFRDMCQVTMSLYITCFFLTASLTIRWGYQQRWKLCRKLGRSFPVGLGTSSRILRGSPAVFVLSRNFAVNCAFFGLFWVNFADFQHFWVDFGHFWANFEHFLTAFISRFLENGSASQ